VGQTSHRWASLPRSPHQRPGRELPAGPVNLPAAKLHKQTDFSSMKYSRNFQAISLHEIIESRKEHACSV